MRPSKIGLVTLGMWLLAAGAALAKAVTLEPVKQPRAYGWVAVVAAFVLLVAAWAVSTIGSRREHRD